MLQINYIRENREEVEKKLAVKNFNNTELISRLISLDDQRKEIQKTLDDQLAESKVLAKKIGQLFKTGQTEEANKIKARTSELKTLSKELSEKLENTIKEINNLILEVPNIPHPDVVPGNSEEDNEVLHEEGYIPELHQKAEPHWELASKYDLIDFNLGSKVTGSGFPFYKAKGAKLQRALISFFLDEAINAGYIEYLPPLFVNEASAYGTGQLPDKDGQMYVMTEDNLFAIPTAEVPVTNIYRDVILKIEDFPVKNVAWSSCFRREAGSYGAHVRGLNRLHQFEKVEIVQIQHPDKSYDTLEEMKDHVTSLLRKLKLPFRILRLCGGDLSFTSALTYDFEVYSAAQKKWLEVSSVSNFESYQANRMKLRFKNENGKNQLAHTLNGSALALPRVVAAILENNQTENSINIPEVLIPYTGFDSITK